MKAHRTIILLVCALATLALLAACGDDDDETPSAGATTAAATTAPATATPEPAAGTEYPLTITDMLGRSVSIDSAPQVIAALSPTTVEFVFAVGATSVTRSKSVQYPEAALTATDIGASYQPSLELIAAEEPDLIVADAMLQPQLLADLEALGVPVLYVGVGTWDDVITGLRIVGEATDHMDEAEAAVADLEQTLADIAHQLPAETTTALILNGSPDDFYAAKPDSYVGNLADTLGVTNPADGAPDVGQFPGYTKLSLESIVAAAPDVVLSITAGPPGGQTITDALSSDPAWASVPAVQNGRVSEISADLYLQSPGPRAGEAISQLAALLYPEVFGP